MIRSKNLILIAISLFLTAQMFLVVCIVQTKAGDGDLLRLLTMIASCLFCLLFIDRSCRYVTTQIAFLMALIGDIFLVLPSDPAQIQGILFFTLSHLAYAVRLYISEVRPIYRKMQIITRITVSAMILIVAIFVLGERNDAVALISVLYYVNLILNFCFACAQFRKQSLMAIGLCLFIISDTILGLSFLDPYLTLKNHSVLDFIIHSGFDFIWAFYIPAQILLVFSLLPKHWRKI